MKFFITPKPPFNFDLVGSLYSRFPVQCVDYYSNGIYERALKIKDKIQLIKVRSVGSKEKPKLSIEALPDKAGKSLIEEKIKWMLGVDDDIRGFYKIGLKNKRFAKIIKNLYGLRPPKTPTVFEALIIAITEQQIALPVAIALRKKLIERYGKSIKINSKTYYTFLSPESLAKVKPEEIKKLGLSLKKSEYIVNLSKKVAEQEIDLEKMKKWGKERILNILTKIKGVGPWTAEYMMCRGMGRYDVLPANDMGLKTSVTAYLNKKEKVSEQEVRKLFESFGKYRGYAAFYLIYAYAFKRYSQEKLL